MTLRLRLLLAAAVLAAACGDSVGLIADAPIPEVVLAGGIDGTVRWNGIEGGFWAVQTRDGTWLDPHASLPAEFRVDGLAVRLRARTLTGVGCFHMVGPIVEITAIRRR